MGRDTLICRVSPRSFVVFFTKQAMPRTYVACPKEWDYPDVEDFLKRTNQIDKEDYEAIYGWGGQG